MIDNVVWIKSGRYAVNIINRVRNPSSIAPLTYVWKFTGKHGFVLPYFQYDCETQISMMYKIYATRYNFDHPRRRLSWMRLNRKQRAEAEARFGIKI